MPIVPSFFGGSDSQRSPTHSDERCINLIPALNDKGDIAAFYTAPGLLEEVANPLSVIGNGIYKASNGRCFEVAGGTLYELTESNNVISLTNRGTLTDAPIYRMIDNGIEMCLVNGIDGWLFTFATNALQKIKVATGTFTVTIADPAVFTHTAHGLVAGDALRLTSTTGTILSNSILTQLAPSTVSCGSVTDFPTKIAVTPLNNYVYANSKNNLWMYAKGGDGKLSPLSPPSVAPVTPSGAYGGGVIASASIVSGGITLTSDGVSGYSHKISYLAVVTAGFPPTISYPVFSSITTWTINTSTGIVTELADVVVNSTTAEPLQSIVISSDAGHVDAFLYILDSTAGKVYQFSRNLGTGALTALSPASVSVGAGCQDIVLTTDGLFGYVTNSTANTITILARVPSTGLMTVVSTVSTSLGAGALKLAPDTNNPFLYVVCKIAGKVDLFSRNATTGVLTYVASYATGVSPQKLEITAESLYVTNAVDNTISMFVRDSTTGIPTPTSPATISTGSTPIGISMAPNGNNVYVANSGVGTISQYSRNGTIASIGLPTGLAELTDYYVIAAGLTADAFEVSTTLGGTAVATSGQQAGVHTYTTLGYGFPNGTKDVSYMNGRFAALEPNTQNFFISEVLNGKWWDALNVQTVDANPDFNIGATTAHQEYIVFGKNSGQVYYDSGVYPSPWVPNVSGIFEVGCSAPYSIVQMDNTIYWMGGNKTGDGMIWKLNGFTPQRISKHSIEYAIQRMSVIDDAVAFGYQQDGKNFYVITFPTGDRTFVYDINTNEWHERANFYDGNFHQWEAREHAYFNGKHLVLDSRFGIVYSISNDVHKYGTEPIKWLRSFRVPTNTMLRVPHHKLQLDCEMGMGLIDGTEPQVMMRFSDDGGHSWSKELWRSLGKIGQYAKRAIWFRLGITKGQPRIYELSGNTDTKTTLLGVHLD